MSAKVDVSTVLISKCKISRRVLLISDYIFKKKNKKKT